MHNGEVIDGVLELLRLKRHHETNQQQQWYAPSSARPMRTEQQDTLKARADDAGYMEDVAPAMSHSHMDDGMPDAGGPGSQNKRAMSMYSGGDESRTMRGAPTTMSAGGNGAAGAAVSIKDTTNCRNQTGYIGVRQRKWGMYAAEIRDGDKRRWLGSFPTGKEAGLAYDAAAVAQKGNKAKTNFRYLDTQTTPRPNAETVEAVRWELLPKEILEALQRHSGQVGALRGGGGARNGANARSQVVTRRTAHALPPPSPTDADYEPGAKRQRHSHGHGMGGSGGGASGSGGGAEIDMYGLRSGASTGGFIEGYPDADATAIANANFGRHPMPHDLALMDYGHTHMDGTIMGYHHPMEGAPYGHPRYGRTYLAGSSGGADMGVMGMPDGLPAAGSRPGSGGGKMPVTVNPTHVAVAGHGGPYTDPAYAADAPNGTPYAIQYATQPKGTPPASTTFLITQPGTAMPINTAPMPVRYYTPNEDDSAAYNTTTFVYESRAPNSEGQQTVSTAPPSAQAQAANPHNGAGRNGGAQPSPPRSTRPEAAYPPEAYPPGAMGFEYVTTGPPGTPYEGHYMVTGPAAYHTAPGMSPGTAVLVPAGAAMLRYSGGGMAYHPHPHAVHSYHPPPSVYPVHHNALPQAPAMGRAGLAGSPQGGAGVDGDGGQENLQDYYQKWRELTAALSRINKGSGGAVGGALPAGSLDDAMATLSAVAPVAVQPIALPTAPIPIMAAPMPQK